MSDRDWTEGGKPRPYPSGVIPARTDLRVLRGGEPKAPALDPVQAWIADEVANAVGRQLDELERAEELGVAAPPLLAAREAGVEPVRSRRPTSAPVLARPLPSIVQRFRRVLGL